MTEAHEKIYKKLLDKKERLVHESKHELEIMAQAQDEILAAYERGLWDAIKQIEAEDGQ